MSHVVLLGVLEKGIERWSCIYMESYFMEHALNGY